MIIGFLKSLLFMFLFFFFIRLFNYIFKFIFFFLNNKVKKDNSDMTLKNDCTLKMLQCEKCKIYIAKTEAFILNGKVFCKKEHSF